MGYYLIIECNIHNYKNFYKKLFKNMGNDVLKDLSSWRSEGSIRILYRAKRHGE